MLMRLPGIVKEKRNLKEARLNTNEKLDSKQGENEMFNIKQYRLAKQCGKQCKNRKLYIRMREKLFFKDWTKI